jgi:hypothetical protein
LKPVLVLSAGFLAVGWLVGDANVPFNKETPIKEKVVV